MSKGCCLVLVGLWIIIAEGTVHTGKSGKMTAVGQGSNERTEKGVCEEQERRCPPQPLSTLAALCGRKQSGWKRPG